MDSSSPTPGGSASNPLLQAAPLRSAIPRLHQADSRPASSAGHLSLNASEQRELQTRLEKRQMKEFMQMYGRLVQRCFDDCVNDFTTKSLHQKEEGCVMRCVDKYMKGSERLGQRWQEQNQAMMESGKMG